MRRIQIGHVKRQKDKKVLYCDVRAVLHSFNVFIHCTGENYDEEYGSFDLDERHQVERAQGNGVKEQEGSPGVKIAGANDDGQES